MSLPYSPLLGQYSHNIKRLSIDIYVIAVNTIRLRIHITDSSFSSSLVNDTMLLISAFYGNDH